MQTTQPNTPSTETRNRNVARSTIIVMVAFGVAKIISLAQVVLITNVFGVSAEWDAYVIANRLPEQIFNLLAGGVLAFAFIPIFSGMLARGDLDKAWRTASHVVNTVFILTFLISLAVFIAAPWLVANIVAPGFIPDNQQQTVELMRILLVSTLIFSISGIVVGILQSHNHFLLPALAPIMFDVGLLFGAAFLTDSMGVRGIAYGAVLGALLHLGIQIPGLIRYRARWTRELGFKDPELRRIGRLMLPRMADLLLFTFTGIITTNIVSRLGTGAASALDWGWRLMQIPQTLIGSAMATVIFPTLAALNEEGDKDGKRLAFAGAIRFILIATIPSAVGLIVVGQPIISLLERGAFDSSASALVYSTLRFFALGIIVHSVLEVVTRGFYADKDTLTPLWTSLGGSIIYTVLALTLTNINAVEASSFQNFVAQQMPFLPLPSVIGDVGGLALANTLAYSFEVIGLLIILRRRWHGIAENSLAQTTIKALAASLVMALAIVIVNAVWSSLGLAERGPVFTLAQIVIEIGVGVGVFFAVAVLLRMNELRTLLTLVLRRNKPLEAVA
jgi:putative peptidoglycan lipid II flippase